MRKVDPTGKKTFTEIQSRLYYMKEETYRRDFRGPSKRKQTKRTFIGDNVELVGQRYDLNA